MAEGYSGSGQQKQQQQQQQQQSSPDSKLSLEKIKKQLSAAPGSVLLQGYLLKRSETLRKWNQRWFTLDSSTGKMEYRREKSDLNPRGVITFDADSTITMSPINFHGAKNYDSCCFFIGTPHKKEYYLCAETPIVARAWVATLRAAALVLKAHRDAVNSLSGNGAARLGTVAAVVAAANSVAKEAARDIASEMQASVNAALAKPSPPVQTDANGAMDNFSIMKETLRVKDEELHFLSRDVRAREVTIKELADRLSETADAAERAAKAAHAMDKERKAAKAEIERVMRELEDRTKVMQVQLRAQDNGAASLVKERDEALQEASRWQKELAKAREEIVLMEGKFRQNLADMEARLRAKEAELVILKEKMIHPPELRAVEEQQQQPPELPTQTEVDDRRAANPEQEQEVQQEAVKSQLVPADAVPREREVLVDTYTPESLS